MIRKLVDLLFPPRCCFCKTLLADQETDLCHECRLTAPEYISEKRSVQNIAEWTSVWYYKGNVRTSIKRYKFWNARGYADFYGRMLALKLQTWEHTKQIDLITWTPISWLRRIQRGYDQSYLIAKVLCRELGTKPVSTMIRLRHSKPLSSLPGDSRRRDVIRNAYTCVNKRRFAGKNVLVIDDILTTGATASEVGRTLKAAGAAKVYFATVAVAPKEKHKK